jgi:drug/metabolite transporter (DMT)-like permease
MIAVLLGLGGAVTWAVGTYTGSRIRTAPNLLANVAIQMLVGGMILLVVGLMVGEHVAAGAVSQRSLVALVALTVASVAVYASYAWLLRNASLSLVTTQSYVNPVVAVILGVLVLGETIGLLTGVGMAITLLAVVLVLRAERHGTPPEGLPAAGEDSPTMEFPAPRSAGPAQTA